MVDSSGAVDQFDADGYDGICGICGVAQRFTRDRIAIRESYRCGTCKALLREREQGVVLARFFGRGRYACVADLCQDQTFRELVVYEPGTSGPFRRYFKQLPYYRQSVYYGEEERGSAPAGVPHESLERLTFDNECLDLVLSSDILEHVRRPQAALHEIYRVLRPGGVHLFTVPLQEPLPEKTVWRVDTSAASDVFLLPAHYHGDGRGGRSLVYADFGCDLLELLRDVGYVAGFVRPNTRSELANRIVTVVAVRVL